MTENGNMPLICYTPKRYNTASQTAIDQANVIINEYSVMGYSLTLRQIYYQFVARGFIENTPASYKRLGELLNQARLSGDVDWDGIEDRTRALMGVTHYETPIDILKENVKQFRIDKWEGQEFRPEVWVEKDAMVGLVERACVELDVDYFACRGYVSQSEMWRAAMRYDDMIANHDQIPIVIHLGDHDPSGIDMTRDIAARISLFLGQKYPIRRIALNMDQIQEYNPPPNPAKVTDSRYADYVENYGEESWELDALEPGMVVSLIQDEILSHRNDKLWGRRVRLEDGYRARLQTIADAEYTRTHPPKPPEYLI